jgi:hypothetical protein
LIEIGGDRRYILTSAHMTRAEGDQIVVENRLGYAFPTVCVARDPEHDVALLKHTKATNSVVCPIAQQPPPRGAPLTLTGFGGLKFGVKQLVAGGGAGELNMAGGEAIPGDSGGAVRNAQNEIVGILSGTDLPNAPTAYYAQLSAIKAMIARMQSTMPAALAPPAASIAGSSAPAGESIPQPPVPRPPSVVEVPPARLPPAAVPPVARPDVPPINDTVAVPPPAAPPSTTASPAATVAPPIAPAGSSVYAPSPIDGVGRSVFTGLLTMVGLGSGAAALVAIPAWALVKWGARREASRIRNKLNAPGAREATSATADPSEETFHIEEQTSGGELLERDTREAEALHKLRGLEGRDPFQDAIRGGIIEDILANHAESRSDPQRAQYARDLQYELLKKFNDICPTKLKAECVIWA